MRCSKLKFVLALFAFTSHVNGDGCCWCGKRFVPKEGLWEGFGANIASKKEVVVSTPLAYHAFPSKSFYFDGETASLTIKKMELAEGRKLSLTAYSREHTFLDKVQLSTRYEEDTFSFDVDKLARQSITDVHVVITEENILIPLHQQTLALSRVTSAPTGSVSLTKSS